MARVGLIGTNYGAVVRTEHDDGLVEEEPFTTIARLDEVVYANGLDYGHKDVFYKNERKRSSAERLRRYIRRKLDEQ